MKDRKVTAPLIDTGINAKDRARIAAGLSQLLADNYTLYLKTHNFHWNVTGPMFNTLHLMFEQHYNEAALAVDLIAERIRALGHPAPGSYREFAELSSIPEGRGVPQDSALATAWFTKAADQGDEFAKKNLASQRKINTVLYAWTAFLVILVVGFVSLILILTKIFSERAMQPDGPTAP